MSEIEKIAAVSALAGHSWNKDGLHDRYGDELNITFRCVGYASRTFSILDKVRNAYPTWLICILIVFAVLSGGEAIAKDNGPPVIELESIAELCLENCSAFTIKIYADGRVHYHGQKTIYHGKPIQSVKVLGNRYGKITQAQLVELVATFESLPLEEEKKHAKRTQDGGGAVINLPQKDQRVMVDHYPLFYMMTSKLNSFLNIQRWICLSDDRCPAVTTFEYPSYLTPHVDPSH